ncbi:MAG: hypothetical protein ACI9OI_002389, partial [Chitinophagales bacterium]
FAIIRLEAETSTPQKNTRFASPLINKQLLDRSST